MKVYKYQIPAKRGVYRQDGHMVMRIIHSQVIGNVIIIWAVVDERFNLEIVTTAYHTGEELKHNAQQFIGTGVFSDGSYVLHYFMDKQI